MKIGLKRDPYGRGTGIRMGSQTNRKVKRGDTRDFSLAGHYRNPPNGPGPGVGPYPWREPPPLEAVDFSGGDWTTAPASSHLSEFRFIYGADMYENDEELRLRMQEGKVKAGFECSVLQVRFKDGGWATYFSKAGTQYTAERLETIYYLLESANKPGEILWAQLVGVGGSVRWPYDTSAS